MKKKNRIELSAIYLTAALLLAAVGGLIGKTVAAENPEPYPHLYVTEQVESAPPEGKVVYFTFDDGPSLNTAEILDVLQKQDAKGTFFVTAQNIDAPYAAETLRRIVDEGHALGLHTYSHEFGEVYRSLDSYLADLNRLNDWLYETVGVRPRILRFPGGSATGNAVPETMKAIIAEVTRRGYRYYDWDVVSGDDTITVYDSGYLADRMVRGVEGRENAVVLLHDSPTPTTSAQAVDQAIDRLREQGYRFDALTERIEPVHIKTKRLD